MRPLRTAMAAAFCGGSSLSSQRPRSRKASSRRKWKNCTGQRFTEQGKLTVFGAARRRNESGGHGRSGISGVAFVRPVAGGGLGSSGAGQPDYGQRNEHRAPGRKFEIPV